MPARQTLQTWILSNLFAFLAVAYLSSLLTQSLRRQSAELEVKRGELQDLQAFNEDIIHSMRGGLITTDLDGRIMLLNRTGEEITGCDSTRCAGNAVAGIVAGDLALPAIDRGRQLPQRREVEFQTPDGQQRLSEFRFPRCGPESAGPPATCSISRTSPT